MWTLPLHATVTEDPDLAGVGRASYHHTACDGTWLFDGQRFCHGVQGALLGVVGLREGDIRACFPAQEPEGGHSRGPRQPTAIPETGQWAALTPAPV